jgi:hypothetical protein
MRLRLTPGFVAAMTAYGVSLAAPAVHSWLHPGWGTCPECRNHDHYVGVGRGCDGDCNDPTHHHHSNQGRSHTCVLCDTPRVWQVAPTISQGAVVLAPACVPVAPPPMAIHIPSAPCPIPIRGPPATHLI